MSEDAPNDNPNPNPDMVTRPTEELPPDTEQRTTEIPVFADSTPTGGSPLSTMGESSFPASNHGDQAVSDVSHDDNWMPPEGTRDMNKAHDMALAVENPDENLTYSPTKGRRGRDLETAGSSRYYDEDDLSAFGAEEYEIRTLAKKLGKTEQEVRGRMAKDMDATIDYGLAMIKNRHEFGEQPTVGDKTFEAVANFLRAHPEAKNREVLMPDDANISAIFIENRGERFTRNDGVESRVGSSLLVVVTHKVERDVPDYQKSLEMWRVGPFSKHGTFETDTSLIEVEDGQPTRVETTRFREQAEQDFRHLETMLSEAEKAFVPAEQA